MSAADKVVLVIGLWFALSAIAMVVWLRNNRKG